MITMTMLIMIFMIMLYGDGDQLLMIRELRRERILFNREKAIKVIIVIMMMMRKLS